MEISKREKPYISDFTRSLLLLLCPRHPSAHHCIKSVGQHNPSQHHLPSPQTVLWAARSYWNRNQTYPVQPGSAPRLGSRAFASEASQGQEATMTTRQPKRCLELLGQKGEIPSTITSKRRTINWIKATKVPSYLMIYKSTLWKHRSYFNFISVLLITPIDIKAWKEPGLPPDSRNTLHCKWCAWL